MIPYEENKKTAMATMTDSGVTLSTILCVPQVKLGQQSFQESVISKQDDTFFWLKQAHCVMGRSRLSS